MRDFRSILSVLTKFAVPGVPHPHIGTRTGRAAKPLKPSMPKDVSRLFVAGNAPKIRPPRSFAEHHAVGTHKADSLHVDAELTGMWWEDTGRGQIIGKDQPSATAVHVPAPVKRARTFSQVMAKADEPSLTADIKSGVKPWFPSVQTPAEVQPTVTKPGSVAPSTPYEYGNGGKRRARTFSQVIAEATRGMDAGMNRFTDPRPDLSSDRYEPDWRGHYLGQEPAMKPTVEKFVKVEKLDAEHGLVFGWAIICKENGVAYFDVQDDCIPEDAMLKASSDFMAESRMAKEMHDGAQAGSYIFMWPLTEDIAKAMEITTKKTGLMVGYKPPPAVLAKFKDGTYTGFSIGGTRIKDEEVV